MRKIKLLVLAVLLTSVFSIGAYAQSDETTKEEFLIGNTIIKSMTRSSSDPIAYTSDRLSDSNSYLAVTSQTYSSQTCDNLKLEIYLQKNVNNSWTTIKTYSYIDYGTSSITKCPLYYSPDSGTKYRVKTYHYATIDGSTHIQVNYSPEVIIK